MRLLSGIIRVWNRLLVPDFASPAGGLKIAHPWKLVNPQRIIIGDDCVIGPNSSLVACGDVAAPFAPQTFNGRIRIGARLWATHSLQIFAAESVEIGDDVMMAGNVFICDCQHGHGRTDMPYKDQPFAPVAQITIKKGCWLGQNVVVMPGVEIGEYSLIGANSVVTRSIPARTMAVGAPARVIKKFDETSAQWMKQDSRKHEI